MDMQRRCAKLKVQLASDLMNETDAGRCEAVLIEALYEVSRAILPELGYPKKTDDYLDRLQAVLEVISFIAINLIKCARDRRGIAVLAEIGEGCHDPLLKKKLSAYAQELLVKLDSAPQSSSRRSRLPAAFTVATLALVAGYLACSSFDGSPATSRRLVVAPTAPAGSTASPPARPVPSTPQIATASGTDRPGSDASASDRQGGEPKAVGQQGEQVTHVRIIEGQVLIPVILKNGGETVKVELVMDTGASRTAIHDYLAARLKIDPRTTRQSQAEVADGRTISSRVARIDSLIAGPFTLPATDVELIPYRKGEGAHDGLLGMDFLGRHRFQVDAEHELIRWY